MYYTFIYIKSQLQTYIKTIILIQVLLKIYFHYTSCFLKFSDILHIYFLYQELLI